MCGYFFIGWILNLINSIALIIVAKAIFSFNATGVSLNGGLGIILSLLIIVSIFGYWLMKRWSVYLYTLSIILSIVFGLFTIKIPVLLFIVPLVLPAVMIWMGFKYLARMS